MRSRFIYGMIALMAVGGMGMMSSCIGSGENTPITMQGANIFPTLKGIDLHGKDRVVPRDLQGEWRLVTIAFEREQQKDVDTWIKALPEFEKVRSDLRYYELPVIYEMTSAGRFWVNNGMRSGVTEDAARERTITIYTDREAFFAHMKMKQDRISTLVLNAQGEIIWRHDGIADEEARTRLMRLLKELPKA